MPELPEVETTVRGLSPILIGSEIVGVSVNQPRLRWMVPHDLSSMVVDNKVEKIFRRAKYILVKIGSGHLLMHLGMSGSLRFCDVSTVRKPHDHVEFELSNGLLLRFHDPRRFGCVLWISGSPWEHKLLMNLGPEPLSDDLTGKYLYRLSKSRTTAVKNFIMNGKVVVGVGNIYASEALFRAGIRPIRRSNQVSEKRYDRLVGAIQETISSAIEFGGTTLRDFVGESGQPGYFKQKLLVYERDNEACKRCGDIVRKRMIGQRSAYFCASCQT